MSKVKIDWCENKVSKTGKNYITADITEENGTKHKVSIWEDFPYFKDIRPGVEVEGNILTKGQYKNLVSGSRSLNPNYKAAQIEGVMKRKEDSISQFQDKKNESIMLSSSARDATLIVTTFYPEFAKESIEVKETQIKKKWDEWRKYFMQGFGGEPF